jgi:hypothetical protein
VIESLNDKARWFEVGEKRVDGAPSQMFLETTLSRIERL